MATQTWTLAGTGSWTDPANWSTAVPGPTDTALFGSTPAETVTGAITVGAIETDGSALTLDGSVTQGTTAAPAFITATAGGSLDVDANADVTGGALAMDPGTLLTVEGLLVAAGGEVDAAVLSGSYAAWVNSAATQIDTTLQISDGASFAGDITLANAASINLDTSTSFGGGTITMIGGGSLNVSDAAGVTNGTYGLAEAIDTGVVGNGLVLSADPDVTLTESGAITGSGYLYITSGNIILSGANTYSQGTVVDGAQLTVLGADAAGSAPIFLGDGSTLTVGADSTGGGNFSSTVVGDGGSDTVFAQTGNVIGWAGNSTNFDFVGGSGTDTVVGNTGVLFAQGGTGALIASTGSGGGTLYGSGTSASTLTAGDGATTLLGGTGSLLTATGAATDLLVASGANDTLTGAGSSGADVYFGSSQGPTTITAGSGDTSIVGAGGSTTINTGAGNSVIFVGAGAATVDFASTLGGGYAQIAQFDPSQDTLVLNGYASGEAQTALATETVAGGNTQLVLSDNTHITLYGVTNLTAANFTT